MMALGWVTNLIQRGKASLDRLARILNTRPAISDLPGAMAVDQVRGNVVYEGVRFAYGLEPTGENRPALDGIDLSIEAGSILGIVGPPGSGKTSLLNLIPRLYDVGAGRILLDGKDIRSLKLADLRSQIAFVPQEPFLFAGSIRHNITLGQPEITEEEMIAAAGSAAVHETIIAFPDGYDTIVGEKGVILSGGQKQRVALARALLHRVPLLILDDPISQVDLETGNRIIGSIRRAARERTVLIASHRLSAVSFADKIISLDNGRILESGTHQSLLQKGAYYARTFRLQEIEEDRYAN
jgi:ATP-binding cassette subfamily B protein